jgi:hypothetical protein
MINGGAQTRRGDDLFKPLKTALAGIKRRVGTSCSQTPDKVRLKPYLYWGNAEDAPELAELRRSVEPEAREVEVVTVSGIHYVFYVPNEHGLMKLGCEDGIDAIPANLWHNLPA